MKSEHEFYYMYINYKAVCCVAANDCPVYSREHCLLSIEVSIEVKEKVLLTSEEKR